MDSHQNKNLQRYMIFIDVKVKEKVKENNDRIQRHDLKIDRRKKHLKSSLEIGEKVFVVLSEHLKKKDAPGKIYKSSTEIKTFLNRDRIFTIVNRSKINNQGFIYWIKESDKKNKW